MRVCEHCGQPLVRETLTRLLGLQIEAMKCLRNEDYEISDPPSLEVFIESEDGLRWSPHREAVRQSDPARLAALETTCPDPEGFVTYWK